MKNHRRKKQQIRRRPKPCPRNPNHPPLGSKIKVEPIRHQSDIDQVKALLEGHPRNHALFTMGINTNLRAGDLAKLTLDQVANVRPGEFIEIQESKTGKTRRITLNKEVCRAVRKVIEDKRLGAGDPLFKSQRGRQALQVSSINRLVKGWCRQIGLLGNFGSHTLRKTWGYHAWNKGIDLPRLMICFNHASQEQTLSYLCIQERQIQEVYLQVAL